MSAWRTAGVAFLSALLAGGMASLLRSAEPERATAGTPGLEKKLEELGRSVAELQRRSLDPKAGSAQGRLPSEAEKSPAVSGPEMIAEQEQRPSTAFTTEDLQRVVQTTFDSEEIEPAWGREEKELFRTHVTALLPTTSAMQQLECRASWCRLETRHAEERSYRTFVNELIHPHQGFERGPILTHMQQTESGEVVAVSYIGRVGTLMPTEEDITQHR